MKDTPEPAQSQSRQTCQNNPHLSDRLTPEESADKFKILDGIDAIPVDAMAMRLKPLARHLVSHASYGQGLCYTSHETLAKALGTCSKTIQRGLTELTEAEWFVCAGRVVGRSDHRRSSNSKHAIPQYAVGKRLIDWLRGYFATQDGRKRKRKASAPVGQQMSNPPDPGMSNRVGQQMSNRVGQQMSNRVGQQMSNNPFDEPVEEPVQSNSLTPRGGGDAAESGNAATPVPAAATPARSASKERENISHEWRDISKIPTNEWTEDECDVICFINSCDPNFEQQLHDNWLGAVKAANGSIDLMRDVLFEMWDDDKWPETEDNDFSCLNPKIRDPWTYFIHVLRDRSGRKTSRCSGKASASPAPSQAVQGPSSADIDAKYQERVHERWTNGLDGGNDPDEVRDVIADWIDSTWPESMKIVGHTELDLLYEAQS